MRSADRFTADLDRSVTAGKDLLERLTQIVVAGGGTVPVAPRQISEAPRNDAQAVAAAAQAFAERLRMKVRWSRGMICFVRDLRLLPIAVIASVCLLALKTADLVLDRGLPATGNSPPAVDADASIIRKVPGVPRPSDPQRSWAQQMFNFPDAGDASPSDQSPLPSIAPLMADKGGGDIITGSVGDNNGSGDNSKTKTKDEAAGAAGKDGKPVDAGKDGKPWTPAKTTSRWTRRKPMESAKTASRWMPAKTTSRRIPIRTASPRAAARILRTPRRPTAR